MAEWKDWNICGGSRGCIRYLPLCEGAEIVLIDRRIGGEWSASLKINKDDLYFSKDFALTYDMQDSSDPWPAMQAEAERRVRGYMAGLTALMASGLATLEKGKD